MKRKQEHVKSGASPEEKVARKIEALIEDLDLSGSSSDSEEDIMDNMIVEGDKQVGSPLLGMVPGVGVSTDSPSRSKGDISEGSDPKANGFNPTQVERPNSPSSWDGIDNRSTRDAAMSDSDFLSPPESTLTSPSSSTSSSPCSYVDGPSY